MKEKTQQTAIVPTTQTTAELIPNQAAELIEKSFAQNTIRNRRHALQKFGAWLQGLTDKVSGHSARIGSAVSLAQAGASLVDIQVAGRWKDPGMPAHYTRAQFAERSAIARFKDGKSR